MQKIKSSRLIAMILATAMFITAIFVLPTQKADVNEVSAVTTESGETYEYGSLAIGGGGFVSGIVTGKKAMYARTDVGGAYRYDYTTNKWVQMLNWISEEDRGYLSIESIAIDPTDDNTIYLFAGCNYFSDAKSVIMRSHDGGETFDVIDVSDYIRTHGNGNGRQNGERLAIDPNDPNTIYCGGRTGGLIKSTDGGDTWELIWKPDAFTNNTKWPAWTEFKVDTTENENGICSVVVDENDSDTVYVAVSVSGEDNVFVTHDGGKTFEPLSDALPTDSYPQRLKLDPDGNLLITYIGGISFAGNGGGAYRYNVKDKSVDDISIEKYSIGEISCLEGDANKMVATTCGLWWTQAWSDDYTQNCYGDVTFVSTDGGKTWKRNDIGADYGSTNRLSTGGNGWIFGKAIHWSGSIVFNPQNENQVFITSGNGIFCSDNIWDENPQFYFKADGIEEVVALDLVSVPGGDVYSAIGDYNGFIHKNIKEYCNDYRPSIGSTSGIAYCATNPKIMVRIAEHDTCERLTCYSTDGGETWTEMKNGKSSGKVAITELEDGTYRILWSSGNSVMYTDDFGETSWETATGVSFGQGCSPGIAVDRENPAYVYVAGNDNNPYDPNTKPNNIMFVSKDYGKTFTKKIICPYDQAEQYGRITCGTEGQVFAPAGYYGLWVTNDYGDNFTKIEGVDYCGAVGIGKAKDENSPYAVYIWGTVTGSDHRGVYRSNDNGKTWERVNDDAHQFGGIGNGKFIIGDMNTYGTFYMSTVGLGIAYGAIADSDTPTTTETTVTTTTTELTETTTETATETTTATDDTATTSGGAGELNLGDVNLDGKVNISDLMLFAQHIAGIKNVEGQGLLNADMNGDGKYNITDLMAIAKVVAGIA